ncbi:hypothetical protein F0562_031806 [Nyssa sinensis]|uniref:Uncharacterized protein n=1 Tax=Nyssa sinensis TaxID=561372 RepID=A0A5J5AV15_9ASTE|nr:hypothetical protein F0562_031806 [Nyssa sinensis]
MQDGCCWCYWPHICFWLLLRIWMAGKTLIVVATIFMSTTTSFDGTQMRPTSKPVKTNKSKNINHSKK